MNNIMKNIIIRAIKARLKNGETLNDILNSYPKLTRTEKEELKKIVSA